MEDKKSTQSGNVASLRNKFEAMAQANKGTVVSPPKPPVDTTLPPPSSEDTSANQVAQPLDPVPLTATPDGLAKELAELNALLTTLEGTTLQQDTPQETSQDNLQETSIEALDRILNELAAEELAQTAEKTSDGLGATETSQLTTAAQASDVPRTPPKESPSGASSKDAETPERAQEKKRILAIMQGRSPLRTVAIKSPSPHEGQKKVITLPLIVKLQHLLKKMGGEFNPKSLKAISNLLRQEPLAKGLSYAPLEELKRKIDVLANLQPHSPEQSKNMAGTAQYYAKETIMAVTEYWAKLDTLHEMLHDRSTNTAPLTQTLVQHQLQDLSLAPSSKDKTFTANLKSLVKTIHGGLKWISNSINTPKKADAVMKKPPH